ncbi:MAG: hypothetical protein OXU25_05335 [Thaumarchaeota archaeon]|nr:hypothetical protein [Nitrososphaerota archaeon]
MDRVLGCVAAVLAAAAACGLLPAHASVPSLPCDYECMWPAGSYDVPSEIASGKAFEIAWEYSWEPRGDDAQAGLVPGRAPGEHGAVPGFVADAPPPGYVGSTARLRLPQELEVVGWKEAGFEREALWVDHYDRTMYEYTKTNAYDAFGSQRQVVTVRLDDKGMFYPVTEIVVDPGLSERDGPAGPLYVARHNGGATIADKPSMVSGSSIEAYPHRQALKYPPPRVEALPAGSVVGGMSAGDGETYAYGYFYSSYNVARKVPAGDVRVCMYDRGQGNLMTPITRNGAAACTQTLSDGFYSLVFPREDPDGDGTDADITVRFTVEGAGATVMRRGQPEPEPYAMYVNVPDESLSATLSVGMAFALNTNSLRDALRAHQTINHAREYFLETFSYSVPHVIVQDASTSSAGYRQLEGTIYTMIERSVRDPLYPTVLRHEYAHHVMAQTAGIPPTTSCNPHFFNVASSESCAWVEGWAEFVEGLVAGSPVLNRGRVGFDLEAPGTNEEFGLYAAEFGPDVEGRVAGVLWDIHDSGKDEAHDNIHGGAQLIWDVLLDEPEPGEQYPAASIHDFRDDWEDAGYPSLDGVFRQNGLPVGEGVTMFVLESSGGTKAGVGRAHARVGETVRVTVTLDASTDVAPSMSFYGGAPAPMLPAGAAGSWRAEHAVTGSTREGLVSFAASRGGETVATLHDVSADSRVAVDRTAPRALSAGFVALDSIMVEFSEPIVLPDGATFAVTPPDGFTAPSVSASLSEGGTGVTLTLVPEATVNGRWSVYVPSMLTDAAGNVHGERSVTAEFVADDDPPTFTATRVSPTRIAVEFNENIRPPRDEGARLPSFDLVGERTIAATELFFDYPNRRMTLEFAENVFGGTLVYRHAGGTTPYFEDLLGNAVANGESTKISDAITPMFAVSTVNLIDLNAPTPAVFLEFTVLVKGALNVSDWRINGKQPAYFSSGLLNGGGDPRAFPFTEIITSGGFTVVWVHVDISVCDGVVQVDYVAPEDSPLSSVSGAVKLESMGASDSCSYLVPHKAVFADSRTLSVTFNRPPRVLNPNSFLIDGLGPILGHQEHESRTVTLHTRDAAVAGSAYTVTNNDIRDTQTRARQVLMSMKATYMDKTPPTATAEYGVSVDSSGSNRFTHIKLYLSEPLDASTFAEKTFTSNVPSLGSLGAYYFPGERVVYLIPQNEIGREAVSVSVPRGIADVNGVALAHGEKAVGNYRAPALRLSAAGDRTMLITVSVPLSEESLKHIRIVPSVGTLSVSQEGTVITVTAENSFEHNQPYSVFMPAEVENVRGRKVGSMISGPDFLYTDTVAPTATARFSAPREIMISASEPLEATTVTPDAFMVSPPLGPLGIKYSSGGLEVLLETSEPARAGVEYAVRVSGVEDRAGLALSPSILRVSHGSSAIFAGAVFTSPSTIEVATSAPLDPETLGGISVSGLGKATAEYDGAARAVTLSTPRVAEGNATHRVFVPRTVLGADGVAAGPAVLEAVNNAGGRPVAVGARTTLDGHVAVSFDRRVGPAAGSPGSLDASRWSVTPADDEAVKASSAVAVGKTVWLRYGEEGDLDRVKRDESTYMNVWSPRAASSGAALTVSYTPGGGAGDVADTTAARRPLAAVSLPVKDVLPPTFSARTASGATVVTFDGAISGGTSAADWLVAGTPPAGVSALDPGSGVPASGAPSVALPAGTTGVVLHHARATADAEPLVGYAPQESALAIVSGEIPMAPWIARAADGAGPSVVGAVFAGPRILHISFDEAPKTASVSEAAFKVAGPAGDVVVDSADHTPHSRTVSLELKSDVSPGRHSVKVTGAVADMHGNPVAGEPVVEATYVPAAQGEPTIEAKTAASSITVTFNPPVSGVTSGAAWEVRGVAVAGISAVGETAVSNPRASVIPLPPGTTTITLDMPRGETAGEPIVRHVGAGISAGDVPLGARATKASDSAPPQVMSVVGSGGVARVGFSEPIAFSAGGEAARNGHWSGRSAGGVVPVTVSADGDSALVIRAQGELTRLRYDGSTAGGAIVDASGNFMRMDEPRVRELDPAGLDFSVHVSPGEVYAGGLEGALVLPGVPVFVFSGNDGDRVGVHRYRSSTTLGIDVAPPLVAGNRYEVTPPAFADRRGIAHVEARSFVYGSDGDPPTAESARFAGPREVRITFSEPLRAVPAGAAFSVTPAGGEAIPLSTDGVSHEAGLRTVTLSLSTEASPGAHGVLVPATVTDLAGNAYATPGTPVTATYDAVAPTAVSAAFAGEQTVTLAVSEALDKATVGTVRVPSLGSTSASYTAGSTTVTLHTQLAAAAGSSHAVVIPAGVTDINGVPLAPTVLWAARSDTDPPAALGARTTSPTTTEVDFGEAVRLGDSPTAQQHAAHWAVTEGPSARAVTGAEVVRGGLSVRLTHAPIGASAMPSVSYVAGASHDDASVRDWATAPNYMASTTMDVAAGDGLPPSIDSLTMSVARPGEDGAPARVWARAGDMVRFAMSMSEAAGTSDPVIRLAGAPHGMAASGEGRLAWTHSHTVGMNAEQGTLAFVVSASDGGGNLAHAVAPTSGVAVMVDTIMPTFTARTLGAGTVEVTLSEPVRGTITASEWTVGGTAATGVAASAGSGQRASAALESESRFVLWHGGDGTGAAPEVRYSPPARPHAP